LLAHRFELGPSLLEFRLRYDFLIEQRLDAGELALGQVVRGLGVPSRASICAALASASVTCASVSVGDRRMSSVPMVTAVPRSIGVDTTRPAVSAATSACSSATSVPVARM
jgi:hypothetical protein